MDHPGGRRALLCRALPCILTPCGCRGRGPGVPAGGPDTGEAALRRRMEVRPGRVLAAADIEGLAATLDRGRANATGNGREGCRLLRPRRAMWTIREEGARFSAQHSPVY